MALQLVWKWRSHSRDRKSLSLQVSDISFESHWGPAVKFSSLTSHTLRHLRHVEAARTSRTRFRCVFPRCRGDLDSGPIPPSTNYTAPMSRYEVIPAQKCRRERQIWLICSKTKETIECLRKRKKKNFWFSNKGINSDERWTS